jgi:predicted O-linked N-acetylglucosamine transferase (SPINDLY family)
MSSSVTDFNNIFDRLYHLQTTGEDLKTVGLQIIFDPYINRLIKEDVIHKLVLIYPKDAYIHYIVGCIYKEYNRFKALAWFRKCYELNPMLTENLLDMLKIYFDTDCFDVIKQINDELKNYLYDVPDVRFKLLVSAVEAKNRNFEKSIEIVEQLLQMPDLPNEIRFLCLSNVGVTSNDVGNSNNAVKYLTEAIALNKKCKINTGVERKNAYDNLFITHDYMYYEHKALEKLYRSFDETIGNNKVFTHIKNTSGRLRVGYVSGDFNYHVVSNFISPILLNHSLDFDIHCFTINTLCDKTYALNMPRVKFHDITGMNDMDSAKLIHGLGIDILIDLSGHSARNALEVFALNPAPVQMTYLGFPNTTGLSAIKYRITDAIADHPDTKQYYSEQLYRLPKCFLLYQQIYDNAVVVPRKTPRDYIVVASLNKETKNTAATLETWRKMLATCPRVKLMMLLKSDTKTRRQLYFDKLDTTEDRIIFVPFLATEGEYLQLYSKIDVMLDPFPYSGTTTSCKCMDKSIPIVTKYHKDYHSHNVTASLLINSGFPELVAYSDDEYVNIVKGLSENPTKIDEYKTTVQQGFRKLMEPGPFMKSYEAMLRQVWGTVGST